MALLKYHITPTQESFIKENYLKLSDQEIGAELKIRPYYILQFRNQNGLVKKGPNELKVFKGKGKMFNIKEVDNWLV